MRPVAAIDPEEALHRTAQSLGLISGTGRKSALSNALIAQSLRRAVFIAAPCSIRTARTLVMTALEPLGGDFDTLKLQVDEVLENIISMGDLLEMKVDAGDNSATVLRPAPPAFVRRQNNTFVLLGVAGDDITPPQDCPVTYHSSGLRTLQPAAAQACRVALLDLGLIELTEKGWLHAPTATSAPEYVRSWTNRLPPEPRPETIEGVMVLDTALPTSFYKGRWSALRAHHTGIFVARRPQRYGAPLWSLMDVRNGIVHRFVDIHPKDPRFRDCDEAWRLQAAMDAVSGAPQKVRISQSGPHVTFFFTCPIPAWAARRLLFIGEQVTPKHALLAFNVPANSAEDELKWVGEMLWITQDHGGQHDDSNDSTDS